MRRSTRQVTQFYDDALRRSGLRITQFTLLASVAELGTTSQLPLAERMGMDRTTLTRNLALLERDGLLETKQGRGDRRERIVSLTKAGRRALAKAMPLWETAQAEMIMRVEVSQELPRLERVLAAVDAVGALAQE